MEARASRDEGVSSIVRAGAIALALFVLFNANLRSINSVDSRVIQYTSLAIAASGTGDLTPYPDVVRAGAAAGYVGFVGGQAISSYPLLPALFAAPVYRLALTAGVIDARQPQPARLEAIGKVTASGTVALACAVLYLTLKGWRPNAPAAAIALAIGVATPLWSSASQALWSHGPAALCLGIALGCVLVSRPDAKARGRALLLAGILIALAATSRQLLGVFGICIGIGVWRSGEPSSHAWTFVGGLLLGVLGMAGLNEVVLGSGFSGFVQLYARGVNVNTHGVSGAWSGDWLEGMAGVLVSPSRGLLVYMPVALIVVAAARATWRDGALSRFTLLLPTVLYVLAWSKYAVWWGGHSYGPRLAADLAVPFGLISAAAFDNWRAMPSARRACVALALVWSVGVQGIGAICYPAGEWNGVPSDVDHQHSRLWDWRDSQLVRTLMAGPYRSQQRSSP